MLFDSPLQLPCSSLLIQPIREHVVILIKISVADMQVYYTYVYSHTCI